MEDDSVAVRLKLFMDSKHLTNSQFADMCGIPRPSLSQLMSGRNKKISDVLVGLIHRAFPDLSVVWLMFGEGEMLNGLAKTSEISSDFDIFLDDESTDDSYLNVDEVKSAKNGGKFIDRQDVGVIPGLLPEKSQKSQNSSNPRKVLQITVYYDDSTFETFYPKNSNQKP